ncbi:hypothetical protein OHD62_31045 [Mesorhizobium sp. YC-39]|uniref:hypothetical protein n=1 Tax=unclassified Mesorhizobium TaxID=325217 RepID=UPI0021E94FF7|nr:MULTISPECIES: hypothetical protein [unclassified Mesorhizobium]MCV3211103.1 hypothetical protein [Mesorhizobium sp. YC-2]MCV3232828.1 hypothetical protein [Mesorhizobium sp. YC-39]
MRDGIISLLDDAVGAIDANKQIAAELNRDQLAKFTPTDPSGTLSEDDRRERRARHEADAFDKFLVSGYKNLRQPDPELEYIVETYSKMFIGYRFDFDMTQTDSLDGSVDLLSVLTRGTLTTPISASVEGKRKSQDTWVAADRVDLLLGNLPLIRRCNDLREDKLQPSRSHIVYPITGTLGLRDIVRGFVNKNQSGNLIGEKTEAELLTAAETPPVPTETVDMIFTTTLKSGLNPQLQLTPLSGTNVKQAMLKANRQRDDVHSLTIVMQLPRVGSLTVAEARSAAEKREQREFVTQANDVQKALIIQKRDEEDQRSSRTLNRFLDGVLGP